MTRIISRTLYRFLVVPLIYLIILPSKYVIDKIDAQLPDWGIPIFFTVIGILVSTLLRDFSEAILFLSASLVLFITYVFGSRLRQRGSLFWIAIGGFGANSMWYITMYILDAGKSYWPLFILYIVGIISGRMAGVNIAQPIEKKYALKADATTDPRLSPERRYGFLAAEPSLHILSAGLMAYLAYGLITLHLALSTLLIIIVLGFLQNSFYSLATRAGNRDSNWYIAITGILSGIPFYLGATYLFSMDMPATLFIPYVLSTTLGSVIGSFVSMVIEYDKKLKPDEHTEENYKKKSDWSTRLPYITLLGLAITWIFIQKPVFVFFDIPLSHLKFPLSFVTAELPRLFIIITAGVLFFTQEALHSLTSRAGNRDHPGYHLATIIPKGFVDFLKLSYMSLNDSIPEIIPLAVLSSCLGSLYGKDVAKKIERWLKAKMDIEPDKPKLKPATA